MLAHQKRQLFYDGTCQMSNVLGDVECAASRLCLALSPRGSAVTDHARISSVRLAKSGQQLFDSVKIVADRPFAFHIDESERFPANTRAVLAALSLPTTRDHVNGKHTAFFKTARPAFKAVPQP
jgi:hypothetical protein